MELTSNKNTTKNLALKYNNRNVIVLGASGFIGRWLARLLTSFNANLTLVVRDKSSANNIFERYDIKGEIIEQDLTKANTDLPRLINRIKPDIIFNLAGYGVDRSERDESIAIKINTELPQIICKSISNSTNWSGQAIINVGSALEYGEADGDLSESSVPNPTTQYGKTLLAGTLGLIDSCQKLKIKGLTARLFSVYGPGEHEGRLLPSLIDAAMSIKNIPLTEGLQKRDFTYVEEVALGLLVLGTYEGNSKYVVNLASGRLASVKEFIEITSNELEVDNNRLKFGSILTRQEEMAHKPISNARLARMLNWLPTMTIKEGIVSTIKFNKND